MVALCADVNALGRGKLGAEWRDVKPTKVERWLQDDLVHQPARPGRGQGPGRAVHYTQTHVERLVEVATLMRRHRSRDRVALTLYLQGQQIPGDRVKRGYLDLFRRYREEVEAAARRGVEQYEHKPLGLPVEFSQLAPSEQAEFAEPIAAESLKRDLDPGISDQLKEGGEFETFFLAFARIGTGMMLNAPIPEDDAALVGRAMTGDADNGGDLGAARIDKWEQVVRNAKPEDFSRGLRQGARFKAILLEGIDIFADDEAPTLKDLFAGLQETGDDESGDAFPVLFSIAVEQNGADMDQVLDELAKLFTEERSKIKGNKSPPQPL